MQFVDLLRHAGEFSLPTIITGLLALGIAFGLARTRFASFSALVALIVPSVVVMLLRLDEVQRVSDVSPVPHGVPTPSLPGLALLTPELLWSAFALDVVIAVQGAGVSQSLKNPDGSRINASRDLVAQGAANVANDCGGNQRN